jgi:DNA-binding CsgD family transcriptional regulator
VNMTLKLKLGEYQLVELRRLATDANTDVATIIQGIVTMYLNGKFKGSIKQDPRAARLVADIVDAVRTYNGKLPADILPPRSAHGRTGRPVGRPPKLTDQEVEMAKELRKSGMSYNKIADVLEVGHWIVRDTLTRSARGQN